MVSAQNMIDKRGLSPVVATVALVMITVAAAVFIAGFVVPLVKNSLNEGTECLGYEDYFLFYEEFDYNCYKIENSPTGKNYIYALSIEANTVSQERVDKIRGLRIQFLGGGENVGIEVVNGAGAGSELGRIRMLNGNLSTLSLPEKGGVKTYVYNSSVKFEKIEIYPVLKSERICEQTDEIKIKDIVCDPSISFGV